MRGFDERAGALFSYCRSGEAGSRRSSASGDPIADQRGFVGAVAGFCGALLRSWAAIDRARDAAASDAVAGILLGALGTPADGAAGVRSAVPLVCRARHRRCGVGPLDLFEKPRPTFGWRDRSKVFECGSGAARGQAAVVERALLGRWHTDRSLGFDEELQAERPAGRRWSTRCRNASRRA